MTKAVRQFNEQQDIADRRPDPSQVGQFSHEVAIELVAAVHPGHSTRVRNSFHVVKPEFPFLTWFTGRFRQ